MRSLPMAVISDAMALQSIVERVWRVSKAFMGVPWDS